MNRHRLLFRKVNIIPIVLICLIGVPCGIYFFITYFQIKTIRIIGNVSRVYGLDSVEGQNLLLLEGDELKKRLLSVNYGIKDVVVSKNLPNSLTLNLHLRLGEFLLISSPSAFVVSVDGRILNRIGNPERYQLPRIIDEPNHLGVGERLDPDIISLFSLIDRLKNYDISTQQISINRSVREAMIELTDGTQIKLELGKSDASISTSLQIIITRFRIEGRTPQMIDFRFSQPVVTFKNEK